jgi:hypothetical protein
MTPLNSGGSVNDTPDQWSAVSMTPLTKIDTADQGTSKFTMLWLLLKQIPIEKSYIGKLYYTISTTFIQKIWGLTKDHFVVSGVIDTADHQKSLFPGQISPRMRSHMQKGLNLWARGPDRVV